METIDKVCTSAYDRSGPVVRRNMYYDELSNCGQFSEMKEIKFKQSIVGLSSLAHIFMLSEIILLLHNENCVRTRFFEHRSNSNT